MEAPIRRCEWQELCDRAKSMGIRENLRQARNIIRIGGTWVIDGYTEGDWARLQLRKQLARSRSEVQPHPVGPTITRPVLG